MTVSGPATHLWPIRGQPRDVKVLPHSCLSQQLSKEKQTLAPEPGNLQSLVAVWSRGPDEFRLFPQALLIQAENCRHLGSHHLFATIRAMLAFGRFVFENSQREGGQKVFLNPFQSIHGSNAPTRRTRRQYLNHRKTAAFDLILDRFANCFARLCASLVVIERDAFYVGWALER